MSPPSLGALRAAAARLDRLGMDYAFVGGAIVSLLLDDPESSPVRPTDDIDVIIEIAAAVRYSELESRLRAIGFDHDMREGAPRCRWTLEGVRVDIMPTEGAMLGLNTAWLKEALATTEVRNVFQTSLRLISPVAFIATKCAAFADRGRGDYYGSHDLEDLVTVIDGREGIVSELSMAEPERLRRFVIGSLRTLVSVPRFDEALPGYLAPDHASQRRLSGLRRKLRAIEQLRDE